jgi:hypothetical protein
MGLTLAPPSRTYSCCSTPSAFLRNRLLAMSREYMGLRFIRIVFIIDNGECGVVFNFRGSLLLIVL